MATATAPPKPGPPPSHKPAPAPPVFLEVPTNGPAEAPAPPPATPLPEDQPIPGTEQPGDDPEAPYGRKADGSPRAKPGRKSSGASSSTKPAPPPKPARTSSRTSTGSRTKSAPKGPDFRAQVRGLLAVPTGACAVAGAATKRAEFIATAATLDAYTEPLAEVGHQMATEYDPFARFLAKAETAGTIGVGLSIGLPLLAQIFVNFGVLPVGTLGTRDPAELVAEYMAKQGV